MNNNTYKRISRENLRAFEPAVLNCYRFDLKQENDYAVLFVKYAKLTEEFGKYFTEEIEDDVTTELLISCHYLKDEFVSMDVYIKYLSFSVNHEVDIDINLTEEEVSLIKEISLMEIKKEREAQRN